MKSKTNSLEYRIEMEEHEAIKMANAILGKEVETEKCYFAKVSFFFLGGGGGETSKKDNFHQNIF